MTLLVPRPCVYLEWALRQVHNEIVVCLEFLAMTL